VDGNISYDGSAAPISVNAEFLTIKDDGTMPVFFTCMRQHGGTPWLTTTAGVTPGETITLVFAIFDMGDGIIDSYAFIDNFPVGLEAVNTPHTRSRLTSRAPPDSAARRPRDPARALRPAPASAGRV